MHISPGQVSKRALLIIDSKRLRQAGIRRLLDIWADLMGLTVKAVAPESLPHTRCMSNNYEMTIISVGSASIEDAQYQASIERVRMLMPQTPLVIISDRKDPQEICVAFEEGALGFLPTNLEPAVALQALSLIRSGGSFFPPSVLSYWVSKTPNNGAVHAADLTTKQESVFSFVCQGYPNKKIARRLGLSEATVKVHVRRILRKFGAENRTQLAIAAMKQMSGAGNGVIAAPALSRGNEFTRTADERLPPISAHSECVIQDDVKIFLQGILADGPKSVAHIEAEARMAGLLGEGQRLSYNKVIRAAADGLGVVRKRNGFGRGAIYRWYLPDSTRVPRSAALTDMCRNSKKDERGDNGERDMRSAQSRGSGPVSESIQRFFAGNRQNQVKNQRRPLRRSYAE
jgi:two-component system nitrate/nitrite response regulator NarL